MYWHLGREQLWVLQFGMDGTIGEGPMEITGPGTVELIQTFYAPDGTSYRSGHRETRAEGKLISHSYIIDTEGNWNPRRQYTWVKEDPTSR